jgi:uncharacterized protein (DUF1778 family)
MNWIAKLVDFIAENNLSIATIGIVGFIGSLVTILSQKVKQPCYAILDFTVIDRKAVDDHEAFPLKITYQDIEIKRIAITEIAFWNAGNESILRSNIASRDQLKIKLKNQAIFLDKPSIIFSSHTANNFQVFEYRKFLNFVKFDFEYLDKNRGAVIQVVHDGSSEQDLEIIGSIIGVNKIKRKNYKSNDNDKLEKVVELLKNYILSGIIIVFLVLISVAFIPSPLISFFLYLSLILLSPIGILSLYIMIISSKFFVETFNFPLWIFRYKKKMKTSNEEEKIILKVDKKTKENLKKCAASQGLSSEDYLLKKALELNEEYIEQNFMQLVERWRRETRGISSTTELSIHPAHQQIIEMGEAVVPLLLRELEKKSGQWFMALKTITGEDPVPPEFRGRTQEMIKAWLEWGRKKGYKW